MACKCNDINKRCFEITGCRVDELLEELLDLKNDYLLDHTDEDGFTQPLVMQIRERLELFDELEQENIRLKLS